MPLMSRVAGEIEICGGCSPCPVAGNQYHVGALAWVGGVGAAH